MKAEHLRIGNLVEIKNQEVKTYAQVEGIGNLQHVAGQLWSIEELAPIPLTKEWLERFGFSKDGEYWYRRPAKIPPIYWINSKPLYGINLGSPSLGMFSYVHQLQNLYFSLTGEELQTDETEQKVNL